MSKIVNHTPKSAKENQKLTNEYLSKLKILENIRIKKLEALEKLAQMNVTCKDIQKMEYEKTSKKERRKENIMKDEGSDSECEDDWNRITPKKVKGNAKNKKKKQKYRKISSSEEEDSEYSCEEGYSKKSDRSIKGNFNNEHHQMQYQLNTPIVRIKPEVVYENPHYYPPINQYQYYQPSNFVYANSPQIPPQMIQYSAYSPHSHQFNMPMQALSMPNFVDSPPSNTNSKQATHHNIGVKTTIDNMYTDLDRIYSQTKQRIDECLKSNPNRSNDQSRYKEREKNEERAVLATKENIKHQNKPPLPKPTPIKKQAMESFDIPALSIPSTISSDSSEKSSEQPLKKLRISSSKESLKRPTTPNRVLDRPVTPKGPTDRPTTPNRVTDRPITPKRVLERKEVIIIPQKNENQNLSLSQAYKNTRDKLKSSRFGMAGGTSSIERNDPTTINEETFDGFGRSKSKNKESNHQIRNDNEYKMYLYKKKKNLGRKIKETYENKENCGPSVGDYIPNNACLSDRMRNGSKEKLKSKLGRFEDNTPSKLKNIKLPDPQLLERLCKGEKVEISRKEMLDLTQKNYKNLPEIQIREKEKQRKEEVKARMTKAKEYNKQMRQNLGINVTPKKSKPEVE